MPEIYPNPHLLHATDRSAIKGHQPAVIWLTGLSGSGKSTLANALEKRLLEAFRAHTYLIDGDLLRAGLNQDLGFSLADRAENIRRAGEVACLFFDAGLIVITALISPLRAERDAIRTRLPGGAFVEVYLDCPLEVCEERDPKGLYRRARAGLLLDFTGISSPFEAPLTPELQLNTGIIPVDVCVQRIIDALLRGRILESPHD
jgi:adenylyl-sulfate kinase